MYEVAGEQALISAASLSDLLSPWNKPPRILLQELMFLTPGCLVCLAEALNNMLAVSTCGQAAYAPLPASI